jgi:hypothetical protein
MPIWFGYVVEALLILTASGLMVWGISEIFRDGSA